MGAAPGRSSTTVRCLTPPTFLTDQPKDRRTPDQPATPARLAATRPPLPLRTGSKTPQTTAPVDPGLARPTLHGSDPGGRRAHRHGRTPCTDCRVVPARPRTTSGPRSIAAPVAAGPRDHRASAENGVRQRGEGRPTNINQVHVRESPRPGHGPGAAPGGKQFGNGRPDCASGALASMWR